MKFPTLAQVASILYCHPLVRLKHAPIAGFIVGSFADPCATIRPDSDLDVVLVMHPSLCPRWTEEQLTNHYRRRISSYFVQHNLVKDDSVHPQWEGMRIDFYLRLNRESVYANSKFCIPLT